MRKLKIKQISLAVCLALMPFSGFAAGLGKLNVSSGLGEPFKAEIELLSVSADELSTLVAAIASEEAYATQGITRLSIHNSIKVELAKSSDGSPILKLRTNQPISDPYLDMLIQVDWASGRLQREYTVLLDPPGYKESIDNVAAMPVKPPSVGMSSNGITPNNNVALDGVQSSAKKSKQTRKSPSSTVASKEEQSGDSDQVVTTQRGDTLSMIARQTQVDGVSLDQMLIGLYENNKKAFTEGNMNRLKVGQIIKVPSKESLTSISTSQATQSVKIHSSNWNAYRNSLAGAVASAPAMEASEQKQSASGKVGVAEDKATPLSTGPKDVVKLSAGDKALTKNAGDAALQAKIAALEEETTARENSLKEAQDRTAALEKQVQDMQKLLAMKSQAMSDAQKNAETTKSAAEVNSEAQPEEKLTANPLDAGKIESPASPSPESSATDTANAASSTAEAPVAVPPPVVNNAVTPPQTASEQVEEPSFIAGLMNGIDLTILGGVGGVALLGVGWMFLRNKRRKDLDSFERGILTSGGLRANTVFGNTTGNASTSDTSFLTDFAQSADGSMIDTNDVDPIAEAEVYMAYGRDAQAEEILKDAISKEPKRYELHLKLLEMYAARKDTSAFEAIAGELYTTLGADDPVWIKVAEIGITMEPENPLYDVSKSVPLTSSITQTFDVPDLSNNLNSNNKKINELDNDNLGIGDLDFSLNDNADEPAATEMGSFVSSQKNDRDMLFDMSAADVGSVDMSYPEAKDSENMLNFTSELNSATDSSIDFDLGEFNTDTTIVDSKQTLDDIANDDEFAAPALDLSEMIEKNDSQTLDFDMDFTEFSSPVSDEAFTAETVDSSDTSLSASTMANDVTFEFDMGSVTPIEPAPIQSDTNSSEMSFDLPSFDLASDTHELQNEPVITQSSNFEANTFDLSTINLDLNETAPEDLVTEQTTQLSEPVSLEPSFESIEPEDFVAESPDVDIKLDLVAAYIDMDDKEGARELLDEVIKEGGKQQQLRARELLASLA